RPWRDWSPSFSRNPALKPWAILDLQALPRRRRRRPRRTPRTSFRDHPSVDGVVLPSKKNRQAKEQQRRAIAAAETGGPSVRADEFEERARRAAVVAIGHWHEERGDQTDDGDRDRGDAGGAQAVGVEGFEMREIDRQAENRDDHHHPE